MRDNVPGSPRLIHGASVTWTITRWRVSRKHHQCNPSSG